MEVYFQAVVNGKKKAYYEELGHRQEMGEQVCTVKQVTDRVQNIIKQGAEKNGISNSSFRTKEEAKRKRNRIKFTKAGYPIHNYLNGLHDEREKKILDKKRTKIVTESPTGHLKNLVSKSKEPPRDIFKALRDEIELEKKDFETRLAAGGVESLQDDERALYEMQ